MKILFLNTFLLLLVALFVEPGTCLPGARQVALSVGPQWVSFWGWASKPLEPVWDTISEYQYKAAKYAEAQLKNAKSQYKDVGENIEAFRNTMKTAVKDAKVATADLKAHNVDIDELIKRIADAGAKTIEEVKHEFDEPLPEDMDERARYRAKMISLAFNKTEQVYVKVAVDLGVPEEVATKSYNRIRPPVESALLIAGGIIDRHPTLVTTIIIGGVFMVISPQTLLLRLLLRLVGFGPTGVVRGSTAAALQRMFFGATIEAGSWFSYLQRAGMVKASRGFFSAILRAILSLFGF